MALPRALVALSAALLSRTVAAAEGDPPSVADGNPPSLPGAAGPAPGVAVDGLLEELPPLLPMPELSFTNPFSQYEGGFIPGWKYGGEATLTNDFIVVTPASASTTGWVWADEPVTLSAWQVEFEFHIGGRPSRGAGGGLAFWFSKSQGRSGPIYGHDESFDGLGVFFDTYEGDEGAAPEPFVVAMMNYGEPLGASDEGPNTDYYKNQARARARPPARAPSRDERTR